MLRALSLLALPLLAMPLAAHEPADDGVVLVIHGGAGVEDRIKKQPGLEQLFRADLEQALRAGHAALKGDGSSLDAVEAAIKVLEDSGRFNAGKAAVFNREGRNELNASIMEGKDKRAGAVAGVCRIKNPISAARAVMEKSPHVFFIGEGAERFAREHKLEMVSPLYFWTEPRWQELLRAEKSAQQSSKREARLTPEAPDHFGTVGAVARDRRGNLAAGTSTGGITYVHAGRVGDSPIIGAGTYAENESCAVSCTGKGEVFIRYTVAADIAARVKYRKDALAKATREVLDALPRESYGIGGIIALDRHGNYAQAYNTNGMYRGTITQGGKVRIAIFAD
jgi:beta-aspartyl-peptidase (threonine type)